MSGPAIATVDRIILGYRFDRTYDPEDGFSLLVNSEEHQATDGFVATYGAGVTRFPWFSLRSVKRVDSAIHYELEGGPVIYERLLFHPSLHVQSRLEILGNPVIIAEYGSARATFNARVLLAEDRPVRDPAVGHFMSAPLCSAVQVSMEYQLRGSNRFVEDTFDHEFEYDTDGVIDLTDYVVDWPPM